MITVRAAPREHLPWLAQRARLNVSPVLRAIEVVDGDRILGMVGYDGWTPSACSAHIALEHPAALRHLLRPGFRVPFLELNRTVLIATVLSTNERSLALVKRLGFREVFRGRDWFEVGTDLVWHEMRREECRWVEA